ncbi:MAG: hypothetical protein C5B53_01400, partial [Candidatus Melainabacteria bacterium]
MNCNRFRFLIQQRFDTEISPQDDRALLMHLETCESCQKFHHQVQQVILAAEELPIQDDLLPIKLESLARRIMEQLPQPKQNLLDTVRGFLQNLGAKKNGSEKYANTAKAAPRSAPKQQSIFPHRSQPSVDLDEEFPGKKVSDEQLQEMRANTGKLRAMAAKGYQEMPAIESRELQSTTRPLSEKFGPRQALNNALSEEQPLNLADAIRRKRSESQRQSHDPQGMQEEAAKSQDVDLWGGSPAFPGAPPPAPGANSNNANPPYGAPAYGAPPYGAPQGSAPPPRPQAPGGSLQPDSGGPSGPSVLGAWGKPSPIDTTQWGVTSPGIPQVNPNQAAESTLQAEDDNAATSHDTGLGAFFSQSPKSANSPWSNPWGVGENKGAPDPNSWPNAPPAQPIEQAPAWPTSAKGWESLAKGQGGPGPGAMPTETPTPFGSAAHEPPPRRPPASAWGEPEQAPVKPTGPAGWPEKPPGPSWPQPSAQPDWGNSQNPPPNQPAAANPWDSAFNQSAQKQPPIGAWAEAGSASGWPSQPAPPTPERPDTPGGAGPWSNPVPARPPELPKQTIPVDPAEANKSTTTSGSFKKTNWSVEAEQIETGTWQAFYPMDSLGTPSARANWDKGGSKSAPPTPGPQPAQPGPTGLPADLNSEWDMPIQEKLARQRISDFDASQSQSQSTAKAPAQKPPGFFNSTPPLDPWTKPAQESFPAPTQAEFRPEEVEPAPAWQSKEEKTEAQTLSLEKAEVPPRQEEPRPKPTFDFATQSLAGLANSVMDKLGSMLGDRHSKATSSDTSKTEKPQEKGWEAPAPDLWGPSESSPQAPSAIFPATPSTSSSAEPAANQAPGFSALAGASQPALPTGFQTAPPSNPAPFGQSAPPYAPSQPAPFSVQTETGALPAFPSGLPQASQAPEAAAAVDPSAGVPAPRISPVVSKKASLSPPAEPQSALNSESKTPLPPAQRLVPPPTTNEAPTALPWPQGNLNPPPPASADRSPSQVGLPAMPAQPDRSPSQVGLPAIPPPAPVDRSPSQVGLPAMSPQPDRSPSQVSLPAMPPHPDRSPSQIGLPAIPPPAPADRSPS